MNVIAWIVLIANWLGASIYLTKVIVEKTIEDKVKNLVQASVNILTMFLMLYILGFIF